MAHLDICARNAAKGVGAVQPELKKWLEDSRYATKVMEADPARSAETRWVNKPVISSRQLSLLPAYEKLLAEGGADSTTIYTIDKKVTVSGEGSLRVEAEPGVGGTWITSSACQ